MSKKHLNTFVHYEQSSFILTDSGKKTYRYSYTKKNDNIKESYYSGNNKNNIRKSEIGKSINKSDWKIKYIEDGKIIEDIKPYENNKINNTLVDFSKMISNK